MVLTGNIKTSKDEPTVIYLIEQSDSSTVTQQSINIPKNSTQEFSISLNSSDTNDTFVIQIASYDAVGTEIFVDNLKLIAQ